MDILKEIFIFIISLFNSSYYYILNLTGLNILDLIIIVVIIFYAYEGLSLGFSLALMDLLSFLLSFLLAIMGYGVIGGVISEKLNIPVGFAYAGSFFVIALVSEIILNIFFRKILKLTHSKKRFFEIFNRFRDIDKYLGVIPGVISSLIILTFIFTVVISLPSSPILKNIVSNSLIASRLISHSSFLEKKINSIFGGALYDTLNFLTVTPESSDVIPLRFTVKHPVVSKKDEEEMHKMVNNEREKLKLKKLVYDKMLNSLARDYAKDMLTKGYFSHYDQESRSPFDRMDEYGIKYTSAGENLAFAPSVELAMNGLMNSKGHRENILSEKFKKIGIGVMDGGIYGKMFVQEFSD